MEWTLETYRLDEIERKFDLPCVICVNEGYYSETDTEGFSQGDIMSIDSKMVLHKVASNFAYDDMDSGFIDPNYVELTKKEILVPLNYKGKLRVLRDAKNFNSVRELSAEFPRYAKVRENMKVTTEKNIQVTVQAGSVIELDRILPGHVTETGKQQDKLVIQFQYRNEYLVVAVPLAMRGKFRTEPDNNEYTIKEAIDRYSLPQHVTFVDDEIKRVYTQDLMEGIENMKTVTAETLRLNRLVTQNVLVGHYKPLEESETMDTERFRQRTLVVLPIDNPEIREIEVNVLKGVTDDIYEEVFLVRNVSKSNTALFVEGSLYVDFAMTPGIKIIQHNDSENESQQSTEKPPPRPPKPGHLREPPKTKDRPKPKPRQKKHTTDDGDYLEFNPGKGFQTEKKSSSQRKNKKIPIPIQPQDSDGLEDYEIPEASPGKNTSDYVGFSLADLNFNAPGGEKLEVKTSRGKNLLSDLKNKFKSKEKLSTTADVASVETKKQVTATVKPTLSEPTVDDDDDEEGKLPVYDEVNEWTMDDSSKKFNSPKKAIPVNTHAVRDKNTYMKPVEEKRKPTAHVAPSNSHSGEKRKQFQDLNNAELVERLKLCGLNDFADFCETQTLNGAFFINTTKQSLTDDMNLTGITLYKFLQMKDHNWIPT